MKGIKGWLDGQSIHSRVLAYLLIFVGVLILLLWLFQIVLLDDFYRYLKTEMLSTSAAILERNIDNEDLQALAERVSQQNDVCILLAGSDMSPLVSSDVNMLCVVHHLDSRNLSRYSQQAAENGGSLLETFSMRSFRNPKYDQNRFEGKVPPPNDQMSESVLYVKNLTLADGVQATLFLNALITPVTATVDTLTRQLTIITLLLLVLALLLSLLISRRIVKPLVDTTRAAQSLSRARYEPPASGASYREIRALNETLSQAAAELGKVESLQQELIANISHDLRTPLTMIGGYAEMMRDIPGESTPENMQVIIDEAKRLSTLVSAVMDYSKMQSGAQEIKLAPFDLTASIQALMDRYAKLISQEGYQIIFQPQTHVTVLGDETQLSQVICNLINNALTYTGEDQKVTVSQILQGDTVTLSIADTGPGIAPEELPLIWNRYYRAKENHKRAVIGTGLGLSIVQKILEGHRLPYGVESQEGQGTRFWFQMPILSAIGSANASVK